MRSISRNVPWLILLATVMTVVVPLAAYADGVPAAVIEVAATGGTTILEAGTVSGTGLISGPEGGSESSTATASYNGSIASVSGSGSTSGGVSTANSSALAEVTFYFEVEGSAPGVTTVPLIFTGSDLTSASGADAEALAYFETPGGQLYACSAAGDAVGACGTEPSSNGGQILYNASPGGLYDVQVIASGSSGLGSGSWSASVDPEVEINPTFAYADDFTIDFSPSSSPTPAPEPSTWTMVLLGIGMATLQIRRRGTRPEGIRLAD